MSYDKELSAARRCQKGDLEEFSLLYGRYAEKIYKFIYFKTLHRQTAEDLSSETFLKALENIGSYDPARGRFSSWIYRIAANAVTDYYRTSKPTLGIEDVWDLGAKGGDIEADTDAHRRLEEVRRYLGKIDAKSRDILIMRLWMGLSHGEISEIRGFSEAGSRMAFSRALRALRKEMPPAVLMMAIFFGNCVLNN